jgi:DNA/RNA endonuclease YhcR with UshA esterase domain
MKRLQIALACILGMWMSSAAYAHHSMEGFDRDKNVTLTGTVKQFKWANPHSWIELEVPNDKGGVEIWNIEMTAPFVLIRAGWRATSLKPGDKVTVVGHPQKTGEPGALFVSVTLPNGEVLTDRPPTATPAPAK